MEFTLQMSGLKELDQALAQLPEATADRVLVEALKRAAEPMVVEARMRAPKRSGTGWRHMWESIAARKAEVNEEGVATVTIGPDRAHFYGMFAEFGTRHEPMDPFLRPTFDLLAERAMQDAGFEILAGVTATLERYVRNARDLGYIQ